MIAMMAGKDEHLFIVLDFFKTDAAEALKGSPLGSTHGGRLAGYPFPFLFFLLLIFSESVSAFVVGSASLDLEVNPFHHSTLSVIEAIVRVVHFLPIASAPFLRN